MKITLISYKEAWTLLNVQKNTFYTAVCRGELSRFPTPCGAMVVKEQVKLFLGKKQLRRHSFNREESDCWYKFSDEVSRRINVLLEGTNEDIATSSQKCL